MTDLAELADSPALHWGFSWRASARLRVDGLRAGDLEAVDRAVAGHRHAAVWEGSRALLEAAPEHATVARDRDERLCGLTVSLTPETAPRTRPRGTRSSARASPTRASTTAPTR